ncbi:MAG TPA: DUF2127 domain-containing protein [bacterium]|nr:DUF2127 domain-containing protein [bacterium]
MTLTSAPTAGSRRAGLEFFGRPWPVFLIAVQKGISTLAIVAGAVFAFVLRGHPGENPVQVAFSRRLSRGAHSAVVHWLAAHVPYLSSNQALALGIGLVLWAGVFAAETIGVWIQAAWGELLVIAETAAFLPVEGWRIAHHPRPPEFVAVSINLLILGYLIRKYLRRRRGEA